MKITEPRTSKSHPLQIAEIAAGADYGMVGLTLCPGKKQMAGLTGSWDRDLVLDLDTVEAWKAAVVVTLVEAYELERLQVSGLGDAVRNRHMEWVHLPIRDRGVPDAAFEAQWATVGEGLRAQLRSGFNVLVHCMGGLGRAGTIASRLLVELGWTPDDAVSEVRQVRPGAIETGQQLEFVHGCSTVPERAPNQSGVGIRDRAVGSLLGLAVGDALGTTLEFSARDSRPRLIDMVGGGPFQLKPGQWTDDTSMALALADSLVSCDGLDEQDLMTRFVRWMDEGAYASNGRCFDIGMTVRGALTRFKQTGKPISGSTDPMSAGNGSLMRLAPVAIRYRNDRETMRDVAARQSRTTHGAAEAVDACAAFVELLADAIAGKPRTEVLRKRDELPWSGAIGSIMAGSWRGKTRQAIRSSGYVAHSLEAAIWCVGRTATFGDAVLLAANLCDDADTVAAITGQLAGAIYGMSGIPKRWIELIACRQKIEEAAAQLFEASGPTT